MTPAPGSTGPRGPFPARVGDDEARDRYDRLRRRVLWALPSGLYVVGSRAGDRRNLMTLNWATQVSSDPKLVAIGVDRAAYTHELIEAGGVFSLCLIARDDRAIVRKFTKPVEIDAAASTANGFGYHTAVTGAPILDAAPAWLDCEVRQAVPTGDHTLFIGEVVDCDVGAGEEVVALRMEDTRMNYGG